MQQKIERMRELNESLAEADAAYYRDDAPAMSDRDYDLLFDELAGLERETGVVLSGSPAHKVSGAILAELTPVRHSKPMRSARKTKSRGEIARFVGGKAAVISWKLDGLTLVLRYGGGRLVQALTRGADGMVGEDVTHTVRVMQNVPLEIPCTEPFEARGEGVVSWDNFHSANGEAEEPYAHPRSLAAGGIRRLDAGKTQTQRLEFFAFELISENVGAESKIRQLEFLAENGFAVVPHVPVRESSREDTLEIQLGAFAPEEFGYPADGLIIEYNDLAYGRSLGATGHHENRLIALKWEDELYETTFLGLELATTRTGMISLTGKFADVEIGGATVNRAFLHNLNILDGFELGVGDNVKIYKANAIIPQLAENLTRSGTFEYPAECPCCGAAPVVRTSEKGTRMLFCENPSCPAKLVRKFVHFCDKTRMNIPGLSEKTLGRLIEAGFVKNFGDLFELRSRFVEIARLPGFGPDSVSKLLNAIEAARERTLAQFISALGIHTVGRSAGRTLNAHFKGDWNAFEAAVRDGFDFTRLEDFGQTMRDNIQKWHADAEAEKLWRPALKHVKFIKEEENHAMNANNPFYGKTVVATGKLANYTRDGIQTKLLSLGARPASAVTKATDYLIAGEKAGGKLDKARELGVQTLTEADFEAMLSEGGR